MAKISGGVKISRLWASSSAKKVLLTAEKVGIGPKMAKIQYGVKSDIFKITTPENPRDTSLLCGEKIPLKSRVQWQNHEQWPHVRSVPTVQQPHQCVVANQPPSTPTQTDGIAEASQPWQNPTLHGTTAPHTHRMVSQSVPSGSDLHPCAKRCHLTDHGIAGASHLCQDRTSEELTDIVRRVCPSSEVVTVAVREKACPSPSEVQTDSMRRRACPSFSVEHLDNDEVHTEDVRKRARLEPGTPEHLNT